MALATTRSVHDRYRIPRSSKRRGGVACQECYRRKIRCDVELSSIPCTNCKLDGVRCILYPGKCKSLARLNQIKAVVYRSLSANPEASHLSSSLKEQLHALSQSPPHRKPVIHIRPSEKDCHTEENQIDSPCERQGSVQGCSNATEKDMTPMQQPITDPYPHENGWTLPKYIRPLPTHLDSRDRSYLLSKGALTIPDDAFQSALLKSYMEYVHNFLPVIDMHEFLRSVLHDGDDEPESARISLFLYQAVMFASVASVPFELLARAGFTSRAEARATFYSKVKALYDLEYETDRLCLVQGLLLMAYWQDFSRQPKYVSYWIEIVWSNIQVMGLVETILDTSREQGRGNRRQLYKRIWWSCFAIDRVIALASRKLPTMALSPGLETARLETSDFDIAPYPENIVRALGSSPVMEKLEQQTKLVKMCISKVDLCLHLDKVISRKRGLSPLQLHGLCQRQAALEIENVEKCAEGLREWYNGFITVVLGDIIAQPERDKVTDLHQTILFIMFDATSGLLLSRELFLKQQYLRGSGGSRHVEGLRHKRILAAVGVTTSFLHLRCSDLLHCLYPSLMALLLPATITHLMQMRFAGDPHLRGQNANSFGQCVGIFRSLAQVHPYVQQWASFLETAAAADTSRHPFSPTNWGCTSSHSEDSDISLSPQNSTGTSFSWAHPELAPLSEGVLEEGHHRFDQTQEPLELSDQIITAGQSQSRNDIDHDRNALHPEFEVSVIGRMLGSDKDHNKACNKSGNPGFDGTSPTCVMTDAEPPCRSEAGSEEKKTNSVTDVSLFPSTLYQDIDSPSGMLERCIGVGDLRASGTESDGSFSSSSLCYEQKSNSEPEAEPIETVLERWLGSNA